MAHLSDVREKMMLFATISDALFQAGAITSQVKVLSSSEVEIVTYRYKNDINAPEISSDDVRNSMNIEERTNMMRKTHTYIKDLNVKVSFTDAVTEGEFLIFETPSDIIWASFVIAVIDAANQIGEEALSLPIMSMEKATYLIDEDLSVFSAGVAPVIVVPSKSHSEDEVWKKVLGRAVGSQAWERKDDPEKPGKDYLWTIETDKVAISIFHA